MIRQKRSYRDKLLDRPQLLDRIQLDRVQGKRVVFTNGCFDLLHSGHLALLESAAERGDVLVVGVNEDASVAGLKGADRPFVPFDQRAALLAGLETVDYVVGFTESTPLRLIEDLHPDVLVKGADWSTDSIVGRSVVEVDLFAFRQILIYIKILSITHGQSYMPPFVQFPLLTQS